jgi:hypothetical protein
MNQIQKEKNILQKKEKNLRSYTREIENQFSLFGWVRGIFFKFSSKK